MDKLVKQAWLGARVSDRGLCSVVAAVQADRGPAGPDRKWRWGQPLELPGREDYLAPDDGEDRFNALDVILGDREVVRGQHREVCELADLDGAFPGLFP